MPVRLHTLHGRTDKMPPVHKERVGDVTAYHGDCVDILGRMSEGWADLVFADPPFNIGYDYGLSYSDNLEYQDYLDWTSRWLRKAHRALKPTGAVWVAIGSNLQAELKLLMDKAGFYWRNSVVWHYTFGPAQRGCFTSSYVMMHYATKHSKEWTWNPEPILVPSARQMKYNDRRAVGKGGKVPDNVWVLHPDQYQECFGAGEDAWLGSRIAGTFKERTGHPCQMPVAVVSRAVLACSNPGDTVLDPFLGSGTTGEACLLHKRKCVGVEQSGEYLDRFALPRLRKVLESQQTLEY